MTAEPVELPPIPRGPLSLPVTHLPRTSTPMSIGPAPAAAPPAGIPVVTLQIPHPGALFGAVFQKYGWVLLLLAGMWLNAHSGEILSFVRAHLPAIGAAADAGPAPDANATDAPTVGATLRDLVSDGYAQAILAGADAAQANRAPADVVAAIQTKLHDAMAAPAAHMGKVMNNQFGTANTPLSADQAAKLKAYLQGIVPTLHPARKKAA